MTRWYGGTLSLLLAFMLVIAAMRPAVVKAQGVPGWVEERTRMWYDAFNGGDPVAMGSLYAADAVLLLQGQVFQGRTAIEAFHRSNFGVARFDCTWTIDGMSAVDKLAVVWGTDTCEDTPKSGGALQHWRGRWLMVYQRQSDGSWMIVRDSGEDAR